MEASTQLSPQSLTAVEILESIDASHRDQALEMLRNFVYELRSEQKWEELLSKHPGPMREMAKEAIKEHREGKKPGTIMNSFTVKSYWKSYNELSQDCSAYKSSR